jgi:predicted nucleic acid-binding protein
MIVVADTSPINYLLVIQEIDVLPKMYGQVVVPRTVQQELQQRVAPEVVRAWINSAPSWLEVRTPNLAPDSSFGEARSG